MSCYSMVVGRRKLVIECLLKRNKVTAWGRKPALRQTILSSGRWEILIVHKSVRPLATVSLAGFISTINQSAALDTECEPLVDAHSKSLSAFIAARLAAAYFLFAGGFAGLASFAVFAFALFAARIAWFFFLLAANFALCSASSASSASLNAILNSLS